MTQIKATEFIDNLEDNESQAQKGFAGLSKLWLEWQVVKDDDKDLLSFDFKLVEKNITDMKAYQVSVPLLALLELAEKYNWLQVLRNPQHRPQDPYELVRFIKMLESL